MGRQKLGPNRPEALAFDKRWLGSGPQPNNETEVGAPTNNETDKHR